MMCAAVGASLRAAAHLFYIKACLCLDHPKELCKYNIDSKHCGM